MEIYSMDQMLDGAVQEKFSQAMHELAEDVLDPNKKAKAKRKVTITLTVEPNEERDIAGMSVDVKTSLAPNNPVGGRIIFDRNSNGTAVCGEIGGNKNQLAISTDSFGNTSIVG